MTRPADDPRFTLGLALDVARVLTQHGYPEIKDGPAFLDLQQALFRFLYREEEPKAAAPPPCARRRLTMNVCQDCGRVLFPMRFPSGEEYP